MASGADLHAASAGAGTPPPTDSPPAAKKAAAAWKRPGNGVAPAVVAPGIPIMDTDSWPALPGLASPPPPTPPKASPKADAAPPSSTLSQVAVISPLSLGSPGAADANSDHDAPVRNPPARRALMMPAGDGLEKRVPVPEPSPVYVPNGRSNGGGDHHQNGRFGSHPHSRGGNYGGGSRRINGGGGGGRRGQEHHGSFDGHRRGNGRRDGHGPGHQQRGHQPSYIRAPLAVVAAPPPPPPFVSAATPQTPPYGPPIGFPEMAPHVYYFAVPPSDGAQPLSFVPHPASPPAMLIPQIDPLQKDLLRQIEYYFSDDNLCKDTFLRGHMDDQGWVPISLITTFNQVKLMTSKVTNTVQLILDTMVLSTVLEVQGDKIRRRARWEAWLLPKPNHSTGSSSGSLSPVTSNVDALSSQFQSVGFEGATYQNAMQGMSSEALLTRSATSVNLGYQGPTAGGLYSNASGPPYGQKTSRSLLRSDTF